MQLGSNVQYTRSAVLLQRTEIGCCMLSLRPGKEFWISICVTAASSASDLSGVNTCGSSRTCVHDPWPKETQLTPQDACPKASLNGIYTPCMCAGARQISDLRPLLDDARPGEFLALALKLARTSVHKNNSAMC